MNNFVKFIWKGIIRFIFIYTLLYLGTGILDKFIYHHNYILETIVFGISIVLTEITLPYISKAVKRIKKIISDHVTITVVR